MVVDCARLVYRTQSYVLCHASTSMTTAVTGFDRGRMSFLVDVFSVLFFSLCKMSGNLGHIHHMVIIYHPNHIHPSVDGDGF